MRPALPHLLLLGGLGLSAVLQIVSPQLDDYAVNILILAGINIVLAVSLNLVNGHTGQFSLGHAGFMAAGAYASSLVTLASGQLTSGGDPVVKNAVFLGALLAGGGFAAMCGFLVGVPSLRLRGDYLAIVTLGFGEIIRVVLQNTDAVGGARGLEGIPALTNLFWTFGIATVTIYTVACLVNSTYGRGFIAVRDDEIAAEAMGISTTRYKVSAFVVGAFFAGLAGGLFAHYISFIAPETFNFLKSVDVVVMVILGGMGSTPGVVAAAILLTLLNEILRDFEQYRMIVFSLLLIILMIARPQGLLGNFRKKRKETS
jgi:branched-chain amino acid transport system permease protein